MIMSCRKFFTKFFSILLFVGVGGVSTAHAVKVELWVNNVLVHQTSDVATPSATQAICSLAPCTGANGKVISVGIASGTYGGVQVLSGARGDAKIETNNTTIATSTTISNTVNVLGGFRMLVPGELKIVTSSDFTLRPGTTSTLSGGGTFQALGRGATKCDKNSAGTYVNSLCTISDITVDSTNYSNDCTLCRSYGFTDSGYVLRKDLATGTWTLPASGVIVTMTSAVDFKNAGNTATKTEPIGGALTTQIPAGSLAEQGRFYINLSQNELVPCEPYLEPCANSEKKSSTIRFQNMQVNDQVNLPATSTDLATSEFGVTTAELHKLEVPIDVQPIDPVPDPNNPGFFLPGVNNDWTQSEGNLHVLALRTPEVDTCLIVPFDGNTPLAFLSVANSALVPFTQVSQYLVNDVCIGLRFQFDKSAINATIEGLTSAEKQLTCNDSPIAALIIQEGVEAQTTYALAPAQGSGRNASYAPGSDECTVNGSTVTCQVSVPVTGSQVIKCAVPAGG
jgi:hypothetical protein